MRLLTLFWHLPLEVLSERHGLGAGTHIAHKQYAGTSGISQEATGSDQVLLYFVDAACIRDSALGWEGGAGVTPIATFKREMKL